MKFHFDIIFDKNNEIENALLGSRKLKNKLKKDINKKDDLKRPSFLF